MWTIINAVLVALYAASLVILVGATIYLLRKVGKSIK